MQFSSSCVLAGELALGAVVPCEACWLRARLEKVDLFCMLVLHLGALQVVSTPGLSQCVACFVVNCSSVVWSLILVALLCCTLFE